MRKLTTVKSRIYKGGRVMSGSVLFQLLADNKTKEAEKHAQKLDAEMKARGEKLPPFLQNFAIGDPRNTEFRQRHL